MYKDEQQQYFYKEHENNKGFQNKSEINIENYLMKKRI